MMFSPSFRSRLGNTNTTRETIQSLNNDQKVFGNSFHFSGELEDDVPDVFASTIPGTNNKQLFKNTMLSSANTSIHQGRDVSDPSYMQIRVKVAWIRIKG
jgi:hypothetical protein